MSSPVRTPWPRAPFPAQRGFSLLETLAVVAIVAVVVSLLFPVGSSMLRQSQAAKCSSNLRQIWMGLQSFAQDNDNNLPYLTTSAHLDWEFGAITPYIPKRPDGRAGMVFVCPAANYKGYKNSDLSRTYTAADTMMGLDPASGQVVFDYTSQHRNLLKIAYPASSILLFDGVQSPSLRYCAIQANWGNVSSASDLKANNTQATYVDYRHDNNSANLLYADGHVAPLIRADGPSVTKRQWQGL